MPKVEDRFLDWATAKKLPYNKINWTKVKKDHPDWNYQYIYEQLGEAGLLRTELKPARVESTALGRAYHKIPPQAREFLEAIPKLAYSPVGAVKEAGRLPSPTKAGAYAFADMMRLLLPENLEKMYPPEKPSPEQAIGGGFAGGVPIVGAFTKGYPEAEGKYPYSRMAGHLPAMLGSIAVAGGITKAVAPKLAKKFIPRLATEGAVYGQLRQPGSLEASIEDALAFVTFGTFFKGLGKILRGMKKGEVLKDIPEDISPDVSTPDVVTEIGSTLRNTLAPFEIKALQRGLRRQRFDWMRMRKQVKAIERERAKAEAPMAEGEITGEGFTMRPERRLLTAPEEELKPEVKVRGEPKPEAIAEKPVAPIEKPAEIKVGNTVTVKKGWGDLKSGDRVEVAEINDLGDVRLIKREPEFKTTIDYGFTRKENISLKPAPKGVKAEMPAGKEYPTVLYKVDKPSKVEWYSDIVTAHQEAKFKEKYGQGSFAVKTIENPEIIKDVINKGWVKDLKPAVKKLPKSTHQLWNEAKIQRREVVLDELNLHKIWAKREFFDLPKWVQDDIYRYVEKPPKIVKPAVGEKPTTELYGGFPLTKFIPEKVKKVGEFLYQARNRVKDPRSKAVIDEINDAWGKRGRLEGTYQERVAEGGLWKLSDQDAELLTQFRMGKVEKITPEIQKANQSVEASFNEMFSIANKLGIKVKMPDGVERPIGQVKNYVPRQMKYDIAREVWEDIVKANREAQKVAKATGRVDSEVFADIVNRWYKNRKFNPRIMQSIGYMLKTKQALTPGEAVAKLDNHSFNDLYRPFSNIERPRVLDLPLDFWENNMKIIMARYIHGFAKRIPEIEKWGQGPYTRVSKTLAELSREGLTEESRLLSEIVKSFTGTLEREKGLGAGWRKFTEAYTGYQVGAKIGLGTASIPQVTQPTISFIPMTRITDWVGSGLRLLTDSGFRKWVRETGAPGIRQVELIGGQKLRGRASQFAEITTKLSLFQRLNRYLQYWSAGTGRRAIERWHKQAKTSEFARRQLKDWGIDPTKPLSKELHQEGSFRFAMDTQVQRNVLKDPLFANNPRWRWLFLFKRFGYRQMNYFKDHILREVKYGNPLPILRLIAGGAIGGEFVIWAKNNIRSFLTGRPYYRDEDTIWHRVINNLASVGTIGWVTDVGKFDQLTPVEILKDVKRTAQFFATPVIASDLKRAESIVDGFLNDWDKRGSEAALRRALPKVFGAVGGVLANYFKERLKTEEQFDQTMKFFKSEVRQKAYNFILNGDYDKGYDVIDRWNIQNDEYFIGYPTAKEVNSERERRQKMKEKY